MNYKEKIKLEKELKSLKFKKVYFNDKSSYWFEKLIKTKSFNFKVYCDPEFEHLILQIEIYHDSTCFNLKDKQFEDVYRFIPSFRRKLTIKEVKKVINMIKY